MTKPIIIFMLIFVISCRQINTKSIVQSNYANFIDTSKIVILPYDNSIDWVFKNCKPTGLTLSDLREIDSLINDCIDKYNPQKENEFNDLKIRYPKDNFDIKFFTIDLKRYKRQYFAVINKNGDKEVWINCFCNACDQDWKKGLIFVHDGGNCFFNVKINLTTKKYYELMVNGEA